MTLDEFCALDLEAQQKHLREWKAQGRSLQEPANEWDIPYQLIRNVLAGKRLEPERIQALKEQLAESNRAEALAEDLKARIEAAYPDETDRRAMVVVLAGLMHMDTGCQDNYGQVLIYTDLSLDDDNRFIPFVCPD